MVVTFERVRETVSLPPSDRLDFEVNFLLPWFRAKAAIFKNLKKKLLFDVIKNLQLVSLPSDDVIIKQGEIGNCMYIILRGQVGIYNKDGTDVESTESVNKIEEDLKKLKRKLLGNFIVTLKSGAAFGEVALMSDDCVRSASVITDCPSDVIVIDRDLYKRSIESVLKSEYESKRDFVHGHPYFQEWPAKYKKQLTMGLENESLQYSARVTKQTEKIDAIYFILEGELELTVDPLAALTKGLLPEKSDVEYTNNNSQIKNGQILDNNSKNSKISLCFIGKNESIGDIEALCRLKNHLETSTCMRDTILLRLSMKHFDHLFVRRNNATLDKMRQVATERLRLRLNQHPGLLYLRLCINLLKPVQLFRSKSAAGDVVKKDYIKDKSFRRTKQKSFAGTSPSIHRTDLHQPERKKSDSAGDGRLDDERAELEKQVELNNLEEGIQAWMDKASPSKFRRGCGFKLYKPVQNSEKMGNEILMRMRSISLSVDNETENMSATRRRRLKSTAEISYYDMALNDAFPLTKELDLESSTIY